MEALSPHRVGVGFIRPCAPMVLAKPQRPQVDTDCKVGVQPCPSLARLLLPQCFPWVWTFANAASAMRNGFLWPTGSFFSPGACSPPHPGSPLPALPRGLPLPPQPVGTQRAPAPSGSITQGFSRRGYSSQLWMPLPRATVPADPVLGRPFLAAFSLCPHMAERVPWCPLFLRGHRSLHEDPALIMASSNLRCLPSKGSTCRCCHIGLGLPQEPAGAGHVSHEECKCSERLCPGWGTGRGQHKQLCPHAEPPGPG